VLRNPESQVSALLGIRMDAITHTVCPICNKAVRDACLSPASQRRESRGRCLAEARNQGRIRVFPDSPGPVGSGTLEP
jgi:hypothetical protein